MNMFSNFTNLSSQWDSSFYQSPPMCQQPQPPQQNNHLQEIPQNRPYEVRDSNGILKGYFWYQGNSIDLTFNVSGEIHLAESENYITVNQILNSLHLVGSLYNFRHEKILEFSNAPGAQHPLKTVINERVWETEGALVIMEITKDISLTLPKGVYYVELIASHNSGYCETLFDSNYCTFEIR